MPYRDGLYLTVVFLLINLTSLTGIATKSVSKSIKPASRVVSTRKTRPINPALPKATVDYPYQSATFRQFVVESFRNQGTQDSSVFYRWMEQAYAASPYRDPNKKTFTQLLNSRQQMLNRVTNLSKRVDQEVALSAWSHRFVKQIIPRFSLERGFEFYNTVNRGERQCFLQSVLIAGMLQQMGINAGVVMVNKNLAGAETNNGHAVTLVKLSNGQDIIVDASDKTPFVDHKGLFVRAANRYLYVNPVYQADSPIIAYYRDEATRQKWIPSTIKTMDDAFIRSQFNYYRGERATGGPLSRVKTAEGLKLSESYLRLSISQCPQNPLPMYLLGRVYQDQGNTAKSEEIFHRAGQMYTRYGWVPAAQKSLLLTQRTVKKNT